LFKADRLIVAVIAIGMMTTVSPAAAPPQRPGAWLLEEQGARHIGLGGASTALFDDVTALHSNPAGLTGVDESEVALELGRTHARDGWVAASAAWPFQRRTTFALGLRGTNAGADAGAARLDRDATFRRTPGTGNEENLLVTAGMGRRFRDELSLGATVTGLFFDGYPGEKTYRGLFANLGIRYDSARTGLVVGGVIRNLGGAIGGAAGFDPPVSGAVGFSYGILRSTAHYLNLTADVAMIEGAKPAPRAGVEYWWANYLAVRAGYDGLQNRLRENPYHGRWSVGLSLNFSGVLCDIAYVHARNGLDESRMVGGLRYAFGPGRER
jgi:hypothetical protein